MKAKSAAERHTYEYSPKDLVEIAARVRALSKRAGQVHVVANNHAQDFAPKAALGLQRVLGLSRKGAPGVSGASQVVHGKVQRSRKQSGSPHATNAQIV